MKFVLNQSVCPEGLETLRSEGVDEIFIAHDNNPANFIDELKDCDAFVIRAPLERFSAELIEQCRRLRVIGRVGVGYDMIDVEKAHSLNIPVVIAPGANSRSVAEHALAMMFAAAKNLFESHNEMLRGNWGIRDSGKTFELSGKTAGIIGHGAIGRETANLCRAVGMNVITLNSRSTREELEYLLRNSDFISLHVPLNDSTRGLISVNEFALMKSSAVLINCSRGGIVDESALSHALNNGTISFACVDVFSNEPPADDNPLVHCRNVIFTPHSASLTKEASIRTADLCIRGCLAVLRGEKWPHVVKLVNDL